MTGLGDTVTAQVNALHNWMRRFGHDHIDILKLDIEGSKHDVLERFVEEDFLPFNQLFVEWHFRFLDGGARQRCHRKLMNALKAKGFEIVDSRRDGRKHPCSGGISASWWQELHNSTSLSSR
jgi:hypothetical protein